MRKSIFPGAIVFLSICLGFPVYGEKTMPPADMFVQKCTQCHDAAQAQKLHDTGKKPLDVIREMQKKEGADISNWEVGEIALYLASPVWKQPLIRSKCMKCHSMDVITSACGRHPDKPGISRETIKLMQKKGADITDEQVGEIYEIFKKKPYLK